MQDVLQALWHGKINPSQKCRFNTAALQKAEAELEMQREMLLIKMPVACQKEFAIWEAYQKQYTEPYAQAAFKEGFCIGGRFAVKMRCSRRKRP